MKSKVYFTRDIRPEKLIEMYELTGKTLPGKVAVKLHSGEFGNQNFLRPDYWRGIIEHVNGTPVECNTAYSGERNSTEKHRKTIEAHGWNRYFKLDLMDAEGPDLELPIANGKCLHTDFVGKNLVNYDSALVLAHFKGHPMGGFGGALKQLSIGFASIKGKCLIHSAGAITDQEILWDNAVRQPAFGDSMADAASAIIDYFKGNIVYISAMVNISVDCDCCYPAEDPCMKDIGILSSSDPVAIDQACIDLVYNSKDPGRDHFVERVETREGIHTIEAAAELGLGSREYELIEIK